MRFLSVCSGLGGAELVPVSGNLCDLTNLKTVGWAITKDEAVAWRQQALMLIAAGKVDKVIPFTMIAKDAPPI